MQLDLQPAGGATVTFPLHLVDQQLLRTTVSPKSCPPASQAEVAPFPSSPQALPILGAVCEKKALGHPGHGSISRLREQQVGAQALGLLLEGPIRLKPGLGESLASDESALGWEPDSALVHTGQVLSFCELGIGIKGLASPS